MQGLALRIRQSAFWRALYPVRRKVYFVRKGLSARSRTLYHRPRARLELLALQRDFKRKYGAAISTVIDPQDEMFRFMRETWRSPYHTVRMADPADSLRNYLVGGDRNLGDLEGLLAEAGRSLSNVNSFLEFACGHGRLTRFLVHRIDPAKIEVSDINPSAVAFTCRMFHVRGFPSVANPEDLRVESRYDVIFVVSLFSHLSHEHWGPWLRRLHSLLTDDGLLVFSTHGPKLRDLFGDDEKSQLVTAAAGFSFIPANETKGRLPTNYYGTTFVTDTYVRNFVEENALGRLKAFYPSKLFGKQDLYVVAKESVE